MDIVNTQNGQEFAINSSLTNSNRNVAVNVDELQANNAESDKQAPAIKNASEQGFQQNKESEKAAKILQANGDTADNVTVERNEIALETAIEDVESFIQMQNRNLAFSIDEDTDRAVVTVRDSDSGDVIRQIPSEEVLALAERIQNLQQDVGTSVGVFIDNQV
ncbi:MAG TPA: flagellar biosynthesis protein FlaG [Alteromonas australica]|jgi:flagellar protein FlaG|uniref:Flagellar biosynthesis protein FlaG n=3 Tax=Alteromonas australica TaxID=589873 RepID=A0A350P6N7_9ALTE|nr:flagellar protein FlaG [Alteromonas australica]MAF69538.1 flagellar biosynthesis protein FlaG [Alteromonas sp.]HAU27993.1 flagellar biosynthesis protein FlaG [Alteromonas australica]HAW76954.1 flagellar biosynthesis protein FlaG [Alteromonas australica]|tara:strand:- start:75124 stop:75612 length:489 start_codon:yes stop_codon:yes gene_type:complete